MTRTALLSFRSYTSIAALAAALFVNATQLPQSASAQFGNADFDAALAAGEFGPAAAIAKQAAPNLRDGMLGQVAKAQRALGAGRASFGTAGSIADDGARNSMVDFLGGAPVDVPAGGAGGAALADFDSLIDLMTTTIAPDSWDEVGGPGAVEPFPGGVLVDSSGLLKRIDTQDADRTLAATRKRASESHGNNDVRTASKLRKVSLNSLERALKIRHAQGMAADVTMANLAGLQKIEHVFVYPKTGDIVIAGPAGDWKADAEGRSVSVETNLPTLQLDDLIVMLRVAQQADPTFGCNITPVRERLAKTQAYLNESSQNALPPGAAHAEKWVQGIQTALGKQEIEVFGIDPSTHAARVLVEADYRMKLVGMGIEPGVVGVESYLDTIEIGADGKLPPMSVLRWWFTLNYDALKATPDGSAFSISGPGVKVLSENELLSKQGDRIHTGKSNAPTARFASSFTKHFPALAQKYPVYAELRNVFDLALVAQLIRHEDLHSQVGWQMLHFLDKDRCPIQRAASPKLVETVVNHRLVRQRHIVAGVSGGVRADMRNVMAKELDTDDFGYLKTSHEKNVKPSNVQQRHWWWD